MKLCFPEIITQSAPELRNTKEYNQQLKNVFITRKLSKYIIWIYSLLGLPYLCTILWIFTKLNKGQKETSDLNYNRVLYVYYVVWILYYMNISERGVTVARLSGSFDLPADSLFKMAAQVGNLHIFNKTNWTASFTDNFKLSQNETATPTTTFLPLSERKLNI